LATSKDKECYDPKAALKYATKAVKIDPSPHILDTLAESLFVNGFIEQAIEVEQKALAKAEKNKNYYLKQLKRFKKHLTQSK